MFHYLERRNAVSKAEIDANNIFVYCVNRGGMMSYLFSKERNDTKAMAVHADVTDLKAELTFRPEMENVYKASKIIADPMTTTILYNAS